ncbi:MAG TPA: FAD binding domain-containing protein [Xanthobacteraceae bacterium]|jgi:carbon-monoxide dehydrogenase medium subunit
MKAAQFEYVRASDVANALELLSERGEGAKVLAGGQSLGPMLNLRLARPQILIDIARIEALRCIEDLGMAWRIGAAVTHSRLEDAALRGAEMLAEVARGIAHRAVRNRGTIGGSVAHADPAADWPVALAAIGARARVRSATGTRTLGVESIVLGAFTTALADNEMIESIEVPKLSPTGRWGYYKFSRKVGDFAEVSAAAVFDPQNGTARLYLGALRGSPLPLAKLAADVAAHGRAAVMRDAVLDALTEVAPDLDVVERRMAAAVVMRALNQALGA